MDQQVQLEPPVLQVIATAELSIIFLAHFLGDGGGGRWLVRMEWRPAGLSVCLPLLIFPCTIKSRSSLLAPAHPGGPGKRAVKPLWCGVVTVSVNTNVIMVC